MRARSGGSKAIVVTMKSRTVELRAARTGPSRERRRMRKSGEAFVFEPRPSHVHFARNAILGGVEKCGGARRRRPCRTRDSHRRGAWLREPFERSPRMDIEGRVEAAVRYPLRRR